MVQAKYSILLREQVGDLDLSAGNRLSPLIDFLLLDHGFQGTRIVLRQTKTHPSTPFHEELIDRGALLAVDVSYLLQESRFISLELVNSLLQADCKDALCPCAILIEETLIGRLLLVLPSGFLDVELTPLLPHLDHTNNLTLSYLAILSGSLDLGDHGGIGHEEVTQGKQVV